ncbi:efflux transporter outer membrane subunit [Parvularcula sp. ZS-1/3]|uniref:Efflux transporter outer membrane subunit n=1 Tax=Parvularcula mediterranea TaxID=2732508 RepID=A0A7Y3W5Y1_9PROT|nr:efflux transporter outer membrane subunit [Parvularcula mediterranea]NNU16746.1 efflux transporter outer membrane subunit [Parvularcula mediterranea]
MARANWARQGVAVAVLAASCATPGPREALEPIETDRANWAAVTEGAPATPVTDNWLADLADPVVEEVVADALENNFNIQATYARVQASRNVARATRSSLLPSVSSGLNASRSGGPIIFQGQQFGDQFQTNFDLGLSLQWELDVWGRLTDQTRAAYLDAAAQNLDFAAARLSLAANAARGHFNLTAAKLQRQLAERDVETGEANLNIIERRYNRGISTSLDLRLARSSLASSQAALEGRKQQELEASRQLEVLLGRYPSASIEGLSSLPNPTGLSDSRPMSLGTPEELLVRRPDIVAAERRLKAAGLRVSQARKAFLPQLSLSASVSENALPPQGSTVATFEDLFDFDLLSKRLVGNLTQPIFQGGRLIANERQAAANARAALYDYATTALTAWREVEDAVAAERLLALRQEALAVAFREAAAAEDLTERRYLAGTTNIFDLINAQQRRIQAEGQLIDAQRARLANRVDLYLALGAPYQLKGEEQLAEARTAKPLTAMGPSEGDVL